MKDSTLADVVIVAALLIGGAALTVACAALALLLTVFGVRPAPPSRPHPTRPPAPAPAPVPAAILSAPVAPELSRLTVAELRRMARASGLKALARTGRRAELLASLAPA